MRKRKYVIGALLSVIGALVVSSSASAAVTGQTLTTTTSPAKQQKKTFGPVGCVHERGRHELQRWASRRTQPRPC